MIKTLIEKLNPLSLTSYGDEKSSPLLFFFLLHGHGLDPRAQSVWHHGQHWQLAVSSVNSAAVLVTDGPVQFKPDNRSG